MLGIKLIHGILRPHARYQTILQRYQDHLIWPHGATLTLSHCGSAPLPNASVNDSHRQDEQERASERNKIAAVLKRYQQHTHGDFTIFVKSTGQTFTYDREPDRKLTRDQAKRVQDSKIHHQLQQPLSVEEYFWIKPEPVKEFPSLHALPGIYAGLSKSRLTMLVTLTSMGGYMVCPAPFNLLTFTLMTIGTTLQSAAANSTNQAMEINYDTQMYRTRNRVLVRGLISRDHVAVFAAVTGLLGSGILYMGVNPTVCYLGVLNYFMYTAVYTPMKRISIANTWFGALVGAIPPVMGWAACSGSIDLGALWVGTILYIWQFPHFKALSWNIKQDYHRAGYQMSSVLDPDMCKRVAFRHTWFMTAVCCMGPPLGVVTDMYHIYSLPINLCGIYLGWKFYNDGDSKSARNLFRFSLLHIPYLLLMMYVAKTRDKTENAQANAYSYHEQPHF